jgi:hypothetical protein
MDDDGILFVGRAVCSKKDAMSKVRGREISLGRAMKARRRFRDTGIFFPEMITSKALQKLAKKGIADRRLAKYEVREVVSPDVGISFSRGKNAIKGNMIQVSAEDGCGTAYD